MTYSHIPVLLQAASDALGVISGGKYIDATLGGAGHTKEILKRGGIVLGIDQDPESLTACPALDHLTCVQANFTTLKDQAHKHGFYPADGVLFDLGVSSPQIDAPSRGFSFQKDGPLDMRMNSAEGMTAADLVNSLPAKQLSNIFFDYGEITGSRQLAEKIVSKRPITTTQQLANITGPSSRLAFQALRIAVNNELASLKIGLSSAFEVLKPGGRLAVISFHSLEDRITKEHFNHLAKQHLGEILTTTPIVPTKEEMIANPRCKSAKLRVLKKI